MHDFPFKDLDKEGLETLLAISEADAFNKWMYDKIKPFLSGNILEIGSGIGNISGHAVHDGFSLVLSDIRENYCDLLRKRFADEPKVKGIEQINLVDPDFQKRHAALLNSFDSVFALNVIEHIADDRLAIVNAASLVKPGGRLIILVPAFKTIYNKMDRELHHFRRYSKKNLKATIGFPGSTLQSLFYFNALGIAGWVFNGLTGRSSIGDKQMAAYNKVVPFAKLVDGVFSGLAGLSLITVLEKR